MCENEMKATLLPMYLPNQNEREKKDFSEQLERLRNMYDDVADFLPPVPMMIWGCGGAVIIFLAGLQEIPEQLYESAQLDGAGFLKRTVHITVPMLSPVILFNAVMMVIGVLQWFAEPLIMTQGGPNQSTLFYSLYLYQNAFQFFRMGYASAMAWILLLIALLIIFVLFKSLNRFKHY